MHFLTLTFLAGLVFASEIHLNGRSYTVQNVISRDFAIIGGGSSGTYAAFRLRDLQHSVVVVEGAPQLGGHTFTYIDPKTKIGVETGVIVFHNNSLVTNYFGRFNISLAPNSYDDPGVVQEDIDFDTGLPVSHTAPNDTAALDAYSALIASYPGIESGLNVECPVPDDLLLPFGKYVDKYNLGALVPSFA
jgi:monoamine oxidase